jgi:hypothetical protein
MKLLEVIHELFPNLVSLNLANNGLTTMKNYAFLKDACPELKNLSLENNAISHWNDLSAIEGLSLKQLILTGNPIIKSDPEKKAIYVSEITKRFPKLESLDAEPVLVQPIIQFDIPSSTVGENWIRPMIKQPFVDSPMTSEFITKFIIHYFSSFDTKRGEIAEFYDTNATFSLGLSGITDGILEKILALKRVDEKKKEESKTGQSSLDGMISRFPLGKYHMPSRYKQNNDINHVDSYIKMDHNLQHKNDKNIYFSKMDIGRVLQSFPKTRHVESSFLVDSWQQQTSPPTLFLFLNGEFYERKC